jgi:hypothetical protein
MSRKRPNGQNHPQIQRPVAAPAATTIATACRGKRPVAMEDWTTPTGHAPEAISQYWQLRNGKTPKVHRATGSVFEALRTPIRARTNELHWT